MKTGFKRLPLALITMLVLIAGLSSSPAQAGVFGIPHFVNPDKISIGFEPEVTLTNGAGIGGNIKYTHGLNDLMNALVLVGTGNGPRKFRVGGGVVWDFFPDVEGQPGIGIATQGIYYHLKTNQSQFEFTAAPYIHKNFLNDGQEVEPFLAFPFGMGFTSGNYKSLSSMAVGSFFRPSADSSVRYVAEIGISINHMESYVSGGMIIYP